MAAFLVGGQQGRTSVRPPRIAAYGPIHAAGTLNGLYIGNLRYGRDAVGPTVRSERYLLDGFVEARSGLDRMH